MINIFLIFSIILLFKNIVTKRTSYTTLNCGIWGFYGDEKATKEQFDWTKFNWIGSVNDERGGDACGRLFGKTIQHSNQLGIKKYNEAMKGELKPIIKGNEKIFFGHSRKTSYNALHTNDINFVQPIITGTTNHQIAGIHNGTIFNYKNLLKKRNINPEKSFKYLLKKEDVLYDFNDSQALIHIVGNLKDLSVLLEYQGTAAFAIYDYKLDELILFSGRSKAFRYSKEKSNERPLYILQGENFLWFSSIKSSLENINDFGGNISHIEENTLCYYKNGKKIHEVTYDRSECSQVEIDSEINNFRRDNDYEYRSDLEECPYCEGNGWLEHFNWAKCGKCNGTGFYTKPKDNNYYSSLFNNVDIIIKEKIIDNYSPNRILFARMRYWMNSKLANGSLYLTEQGYLSHANFEKAKLYYFEQGFLFKDMKSYDDFEPKVGEKISSEDYLELSKYTMYPIFYYTKHLAIKNGQNYTGKVDPLFSNKIYNFENGEFNGVTTSAVYNYPEHKKESLIIALPASTQTKINNEKDAYSELLNKNCKSILTDVLISCNEARGELSVYLTEPIAIKADETLEVVEEYIGLTLKEIDE